MTYFLAWFVSNLVPNALTDHGVDKEEVFCTARRIRTRLMASFGSW
jgi:hypothetical protein